MILPLGGNVSSPFSLLVVELLLNLLMMPPWLLLLLLTLLPGPGVSGSLCFFFSFSRSLSLLSFLAEEEGE